MKKYISLLLLAVLFAVAAPQLAPSAAASSASPAVTTALWPENKIAILYTNDVHCTIEGDIGYAGLAAYRKQLQAEGNEVLLVDCGDAIQGSLAGTLSKGEDIITLMNQLGYDAAIPGNHEFDYGMEQFKKLTKAAQFPYLCANLMDEVANKPMLAPYLIKEVADVKIAFVGVTTPFTMTSSTPKFFQNEAGEYIYDFLVDTDGKKLYAAVQNAVDSARGEGANYVVVLSHLGIKNEASPYLATSLIENTNGVDVVLDGHSHSTVESERIRNKDGKRVLLSQTGTKLAAVGLLRIDQNGSLSTSLVRNITAKDAAMTTSINKINAKFAARLAERITVTQNLLTMNDPVTGARIIRNAETNFGDLCADAYLAAGKTDVAILNGGSVRINLPLGEVTCKDIINAFPFDNAICTVEVTGQELLDVLEHSVRMMPKETGGFLQVAGMAFAVDPTIPTPVITDKNGIFKKIDGTRRVKNVTVAGVPIDTARTYTLTGSSYLLKNSGDGFGMFADNKLLQDEFMLNYTVIVNYLRDVYPAVAANYANPYGEGRIVVTTDTAK